MTDSFTGEYHFLSNFYESPMYVPTVGLCATLEHAYQAMKAERPDDKKYVNEAATPGEAKKRGRKIYLRDDWEMVKYAVMSDLVALKFAFDTKLSCELLATGGVELVEGNTWGDTYWGVCNGQGSNFLGRILMDRRDWLHGTPF